MRVVHLCRVAPPQVGGMETVIDTVCRRQLAEGWSPRIVTLAPTPRGRAADVPVTALRRVGPRRYPLARGLAAALQDADLVHVHGVDGLADQALTVAPSGVPVVVSTHGGFLHTRRQWWVKQAWLRGVTAASLRRGHVWFTSLSDVQALAPARLGGVVVPNGIRLRSVDRAPERGVWLVPGRVVPHKGHLDVLDTFARAFAAGVASCLHIVGPTPDVSFRDAIVARAARRGVGAHVHVHGAVADDVLDHHLGRAACVVSGARHEGFGLAVMEAAAVGVPLLLAPNDAFRTLGLFRSGAVDLSAPDAVEQVATVPAVHDGLRALASAHTWAGVWPRWTAAYAAARAA